MSKGMLEHMVLHKLVEKPHSGYGLCKSIEEETGHRPSYGSIYPLLERLTTEGHVTVERDGRKKIYSITEEGIAAHKKLTAERDRLVENLIANMKGLGALVGEDVEPLITIFERLKHGEPPLGPVTRNMIRFRDTVIKMTEDDRVEKHKKEINTMLKEMTKKLEAME